VHGCRYVLFSDIVDLYERNFLFVQNTTIRENICFGRSFDDDRYWKAVRDSCLGPDLEMSPNGDMAEVGEKGISLSGGLKQRKHLPCHLL